MILAFIISLSVGCEKGQKIEKESLMPSPLGGVQVEILTYDEDQIKVHLSGTINREDLPEETQVSFFLSDTCKSEELTTLRIKDFEASGSNLSLPIQNRISIYGETNPTTGCFLAVSFTPSLGDPLPPLVTNSEPIFPSRLTTEPVLFGSAAPSKSIVKFFKDANCSQMIGQGLASDFATSGIRISLQPGMTNTVYSQTVDPLTQKSSCTFVGDYRHTAGVVPVPVLLESLPNSPGGTLTPRLKGTLSGGGKTIKFFSDTSCAVEIGSGSKEDFETTGVLITADENKKITIYAEAYNEELESSFCVYLTSYVHDGVRPEAPVFTSITPIGPTNQTYNPRLRGTTANDAALVRFYDSDKCETLVGVGRKEVFSSSGIIVTLERNKVTRIHAKSVDSAGNMSDCTFMAEFEHDSIAPENPIFSITDPISPNNKSVTPLIIGGTDDETVTVEIHSDEACSAPLATGTKEEFTTTGIRVTVPDNQPTPILAVAIDLAGNRSDCTFLITYDHSTLPAPPAEFTSTSPPSPTNRTTRPLVIGKAPNSVQRVSIFSDQLCQNQLANGSRLSYITTGIQVLLPQNTISPLYTITLDKYGNVSDCTFLAYFIHTDRSPLEPIFISITPESPNRFSTAPKLKGAVMPLPNGLVPATRVSVYESVACASRLGNGTVQEFHGDGITVNVPSNTLSTLYVKTFDDAGNSSPCTFMTDYIHDDYKPADPIFVASLPASPSYSREMLLRGTLGMSQDFLPIASIDFYSDSTCLSGKIGSGSSDDFVASGIKVTSHRNATTAIYAQSTNIVGSQSPCRFMQNFLHNDLGPENVVALLDSAGGINLNWKADGVARPVPTYVVKRSTRSGGPYTVLHPSFVGTSFSDLSVTQNETYYYVVSAKNSTGETFNSSEASATISAPPPEAASMLTAVGRNNQVSLSWSGSAVNLKYSVFRSNSAGGPYSLLQKNISSTSYSDKTALNGQIYYYVVRGLNPNGETIESNEASAMPRPVPAAPTGLRFTAHPYIGICDSAAVILHWDPPSYHDGFTIHRARSPGVSSPLGTSSTNSYINCVNNTDDTSGNTPTYYSVTSKWGDLQSSLSDAVLFYRVLPVDLILNPGNQSVNLTWDFSNYADSADVFRATSPNGPFTKIASGVTIADYTDTNVTNGVAYYYYVQNYLNGALYGFATYTQSAIPFPNPTAPVNLSVSSDGNIPSLSWTPPAHAKSFYVYRANSAAGPFGYVGTASTANYKDPTITNGLRFYRVTATWGTFESAPSNTVSFRYGHPSTLTATGSANSIALSWGNVSGAASYSIHRSTIKGGNYTIIGTSLTNSYTDDTAAADTGYYYVVSATFPDTTVGGFSPEASAMRAGSNVPSGITVTATTTTSVTLEWVRVPSATRYNVYQATSAGGPYTSVGNSPSPTFQAASLLSNRDYFYRLTSVVNGAESAQSATVPARTVTLPTNSPSGQAGNNQIRVSWNPLTGITTYTLQRSTDRLNFTTVASGLTTNLFMDNTAVNGTRYFYRLIANYSFGSVTSKVSDGITPGIVPLVPSGLAVTGNWSGSDIRLRWGPVASATNYKIYGSSSSGGPWVEIGQTSNNSFDASNLTPDTPIYFAVTALNGMVESARSSSVAAIPSITPPAPSLEAASDTLVEVTWGPVSFAASYDLQRSTDSIDFTTIASNLPTPSYSDSSVVGTETYYYRFIPKNADGLMGATSSVSTEINTGVNPIIPANIKASVISSTSIQISWVGVPNATSYSVSRGTSSGGPYTLIETVTDPVISSTDATVTPGTVYYYVVQSINSAKKKSAFSQEVAIRTDDAPQNLLASASNGRVTLSWDSVAGAVGYRVFKSNFSGGPYGSISELTNGTSFDDTDVSDGLVYFYVVSAVFPSGSISSYSNEASITAIRKTDLTTAIELLDVGILSQDTETIWRRSSANLIISAYDGIITSTFEVHVSNADTQSRMVEIINDDGEVFSQISVPAGLTNITRLTAPMTWPNSNQLLKIRTEGTSGLGMLKIANARIMVKQVAASKTRIYIPLLSQSNLAVSDNNHTANAIQKSSGSYSGLVSALAFKRELDSFSRMKSFNPFVLEVLPSASENAKGAFALYNRNRDSLIQTTETLFEGDIEKPITVPFSDNLTGFDDINNGENFEIDLACKSGCTNGGWVGLQKAGLWIELERLEKAISYFRLTPFSEMVSVETDLLESRILIHLDDFSNPELFIQAKASSSGMASSTIQLVSLGSADSDPSIPVAVSGSDLTFNGSLPTLVRSGALTISSGERFGARIQPGSGSMVSAGSVMLLISFSN